MAYYLDLIGGSYEKAGRGSPGWDCYGLLIELHRRDEQIIPDYASPEDKDAIALLMQREKRKWLEHWSADRDEPLDTRIIKPGHVLLISIKGVPFHVGQCVARGKFIHVWERSGGVLVERIDLWKRRIVGVYSWNDQPSSKI